MRTQNIVRAPVMRGLEWESEERRALEFRIARHYLNSAAAETVLPTKHTEFEYTDPDNLTQKIDRLTYRFLKDHDGNVYAQAEARVLGEGSYGSVTLAETEDKALWAIKEYSPTPITLKEAIIVGDLGLAKKILYQGSREALAYHYLGISLKTYLKQNPLITEEERLEIAIKMCEAVSRLHFGHASKKEEKYAHLDIKLENFTIDDKGNVHLIDFGFAEENPVNKMTEFKGSAFSLIPREEAKKLLYTKEQLDIFALLRSFYLPANCKVVYPRTRQIICIPPSERKASNFLFTDAMINKDPLKKLFAPIDLVAGNKPGEYFPTARKLSVAMLLARYNIHINVHYLYEKQLQKIYLLFDGIHADLCLTFLSKVNGLKACDIEKVSNDPSFFNMCVEAVSAENNPEKILKILNNWETICECLKDLSTNNLLSKENIEKVLENPINFRKSLTILDENLLFKPDSVRKFLKAPQEVYLAFRELIPYSPSLLTKQKIEKILDASDKGEKVFTKLLPEQGVFNTISNFFKSKQSISKKFAPNMSKPDNSIATCQSAKCSP